MVTMKRLPGVQARSKDAFQAEQEVLDEIIAKLGRENVLNATGLSYGSCHNLRTGYRQEIRGWRLAPLEVNKNDLYKQEQV